MNTRKIDAMYRHYGREGTDLYQCGDCSNFIRYDWRGRIVFKCLLYGDTRSEASDWRKSYRACGMYGKPIGGLRPVIERRTRSAARDNTPIAGQLEL